MTTFDRAFATEYTEGTELELYTEALDTGFQRYDVEIDKENRF